MSIEAYEELTSRFELYSQIKEGMNDIASDNTRPFSEAMADIRSKRDVYKRQRLYNPVMESLT